MMSTEVTSPVSDRPEAELASGERRQATVLFCDLVGSTSLSSRLDPEEMRQLLGLYQDTCARVIAIFDGHIAQTLGDGLLVYFGYPQAHEDDAERAVRAALGIVQAVAVADGEARRRGGSCAVRIGICTGLVVVGAVAQSDTRAHMAMVGETPNMAARLQQLAEPNEILVAPTTQRLVEGRFRLDAMGVREIRGIERPVRIFRVKGERASSRFKVSRRAEGPLLVGRDADLALLSEHWSRASRGVGQVVAISGPAGIGKSRLVQALRDRFDARRSICLRYQCSPYFCNTAFHPIVTRLERDARIHHKDSTAGKLRKLKRLLGASSENLDRDLALVARLLGILDTGDPAFANANADGLLEDTRAALISRVLALSRASPVLVVLEDAHWIDPSSLRLLSDIVRRARGARLLVAITHRPEFSLPWSTTADVTTLTLDRLQPADCLSIAQSLAGDESPLPRRVADEIVRRSDGIPFFVEELTKAALESGAKDTRISVPASLQDSLTARLDRVGSLKTVAQLGACIGRTFPLEVLAAIAGLDEEVLQEGLERLVAADLVIRDGGSSKPSFTFRHALVQNAAYDSMLRSERRRVHASIARHLAAAPAGAESSAPEVLAQHLTEAGDHDSAVRSWLQAGQMAQRRSAHVEAIAHFRAGLQSLSELPASASLQDREIDLQCGLALSHMGGEGWPGRRVHEAYSRVRSLCRETGNARKECEVLWGLWAHHAVRGELAEARARAVEYVQLAERENDRAAILMADSTAVIAYFCIGDFGTAQRHADRIHASYKPHEDGGLVEIFNHDPQVIAWMFEGSWLWIQGFPDRAARSCRKAIDHARSLGHPFQLCYALLTGAGALLWRREHHALLACVEEGLRIASERRIPVFRLYGPLWGIPAFVERDPSAKVLAGFRRGIDKMLSSHAFMHVPFYLVQLASAYERVGDLSEAASLLDDAMQLMDTTGERWLEPELHRERANLLTREGKSLEEAERILRMGLTTAQTLGARGFELRLACDLAKLLCRQSRTEEARRIFDPALQWFQEGLDTADLLEAMTLKQRLAESSLRPRRFDDEST